ncbi:4-(cytidine 5'-diphospho)-2-C-methyl-D-erythritol kinase [Hippea maritima]|uniref:4-diphosphocytidyl-2-C-methyl-D-erythritol kinase n=1 Tax=Hippea maritima (strain ATCC 700847 / DSM 10411 / MH2) TaxID=760142 RepID=F2LWH1_HIPMA|nr:4-(cytidine 5'-diphospho)-2-C-methyl-D-erythritol kinase [Hippea maritima]AEA34080.1 4-diphosphocytidyl-2-C-methyl-D-erythritolkinase [Hippea maritima DSM 10411]
MILKSFAKINSLLYVLGKRPDGYHELFTLMHKIDLFDLIEIERNDGGLKFSINIDELNNQDNLAVKAARLFFEKTGIKPQVSIEIEKHIPVGGGLGGGSSNAAYTLKGLNELFDFPLSRGELFEVAAKIGSDVSFFVEHGDAIAEGRGEIITKVKCNTEGFKVLLAIPNFSVSTAFVYKRLRLTKLKGLNKMALTVKDGLCSMHELKNHLHNDLESVVLKEFDLLKWIKETLIKEAGNGLVSGSGSCVFSILGSEVQAEEGLKEQLETRGVLCKTVNFAEEILR